MTSITRTSETDPLRIDTVNALAGWVGMTLCPGKVQSDAATGSWSRNLALDLQTIRKSGATTLVSLMEESELRSLKVPPEAFAQECEAVGLRWHWLPIPDGSVPGESFEDRWFYSGHRLRRALAAGETIVLHCKGGLGRTGMIAARLLVEAGSSPQEAISAVREARSGTIETRAQERHVHGVRQQPTRSGDPTDAERLLGCILGGAVGDAFGYAIEFQSLPAIRRRFGPPGLMEPVLQDGKLVVSDDTQMTLFTLEGITRAVSERISSTDQIAGYIRESYLDWFATQRTEAHSTPKDPPASPLRMHPSMNVLRAPGNTCLSALAKGGWGTPANSINDSKGCGGVMRSAPAGLLGNHGRTRAEAFQLGLLCAAITHGHPTGYLSAGFLSAVVHELRAGRDLRTAVEACLLDLMEMPDADETVAKLKAALALTEDPAVEPLQAIQSLGEGWIAEEALAIGLYAVLRSESFADAIRLAANHDGDSDSTASIAGQLWGAEHGLDHIPHQWVRPLDVLEPALKVCRAFLNDADSRASEG